LLGQRIDLVLLLVVSLAIQRGAWPGLFWGLIGGLLLDFLSALPFGANSLSMGLVCLLVGLSLRRLGQDYPLMPFLAMPLITSVFYLVMGAVLMVFGWSTDWRSLLGLVLPSVALLNTVTLPFVYLPVYTIGKRTRVEINWRSGRV